MVKDTDKSKEQLIAELQELRGEVAELCESKVRLDGILEIAHEAVLSIDENQNITFFNKGAENIFGYSASEIIGQSLETLIPEGFRSVHQQHIEQFQNSKATAKLMSQRAEISGLRKSGVVFPAEASISKLKVDGHFIYSVILHDISENQQMERAIRESRSQYLNILHMMSDLAYTRQVKPEGRYVWTSKDALERLTGYTVAEFEGGFGIFHPEDREAAEADYNRILAGEPFSSHDYRIIKKDGEMRWVRIHRQPQWDEHKQEIIGINGAINDITDSKKAEQKHLQLILEQERVKILAHFITQASHEFRTPLSIIKMSTYLLSKLAVEWEEQRHLTNIEEHVDYITTLVEEMITMSKLGSSSQVEKKRVDIKQIVHSIYDGLQASHKKKMLNVMLELSEERQWFEGNAEVLTQAIEHIYKNAIQFSDIADTITLRLKRDNEHIVFEVEDTGIGIPRENLSHIFEPFYRVNKAGTLRGFGLGLAIAKRCVELHDGQIEVESQVDIGSTFRIILPIV